MNQKIRNDLLKSITLAIKIIDTKDGDALKEISNHTIHNASIFQDKDSITIAVLIYAISKIADRSKSLDPKIIKELSSAKRCLEEEDIFSYEKSLKQLLGIISKIDKKMDFYIQHIIDEAGIKKGSKLYAHGISVAQTAEIFGITQWELMKYLGQTNIPEEFVDEVEIKERIKKARILFGISSKKA
jgi:hypothetical protein